MLVRYVTHMSMSLSYVRKYRSTEVHRAGLGRVFQSRRVCAQAQMMAVKLEILEGQEDELQLMAAEAEATLTATKALLGHRAAATGAIVEEALVANLEEVVRM